MAKKNSKLSVIPSAISNEIEFGDNQITLKGFTLDSKLDPNNNLLKLTNGNFTLTIHGMCNGREHTNFSKLALPPHEISCTIKVHSQDEPEIYGLSVSNSNNGCTKISTTATYGTGDYNGLFICKLIENADHRFAVDIEFEDLIEVMGFSIVGSIEDNLFIKWDDFIKSMVLNTNNYVDITIW